MFFTKFLPNELKYRPAALLGPQKPIVFLRGTRVLGRAGARGGAGAERGGNDGSLVKSTKLLGIFMKIRKRCDDFVFSTKSYGNKLNYLHPGRLGRLAARDAGARAGPWPGP